VYYPAQSKKVKEKFYKSVIKKNLDKYSGLINIDYVNKKMTFKCDCNKPHNFEISIELFQNRKKL
jgi:hypothetical protein